LRLKKNKCSFGQDFILHWYLFFSLSILSMIFPLSSSDMSPSFISSFISCLFNVSSIALLSDLVMATSSSLPALPSKSPIFAVILIGFAISFDFSKGCRSTGFSSALPDVFSGAGLLFENLKMFFSFGSLFLSVEMSSNASLMKALSLVVGVQE